MKPAWNPIGDAAAKAVENVWNDLVIKLYDGVVTGLQYLSSFWLSIPAPTLENAAGDTPAQRVMLYTRVLIGVVGLISTAFVIVQYAMKRDGHNGEQLAWGIGRTVVFSGLSLGAITLLLQFGDLASPWFVKAIGGQGEFKQAMGSLTFSQKTVIDMLATTGGLSLVLVVVFLLALVGTLMNLLFILFTFGMLPIVAGMIPVLAAASVSERGAASFYKVLGWTLAACLFKPVAAIIYGGGIAMIQLLTGKGGSKLGPDQLALQVLCGFTVIGAAGLVLPALVRLLVPAMAAGSRGVGGGSLVMAGLSAAGGAVMGGASLMKKLGTSRAQKVARGGRAGSPAVAGARSSSVGTSSGSGGGGAVAPAPRNRGLVSGGGQRGKQSVPKSDFKGDPKDFFMGKKLPLVSPTSEAGKALAATGKPVPLGAARSGTKQARSGTKQAGAGTKQAGAASTTQPAGPGQAQRPSTPRTGTGRRRFEGARGHLSQQVTRAEEAVEGGEA